MTLISDHFPKAKQEILDIITEKGELHQNEFDRVFCETYIKDGKAYRNLPFPGPSYYRMNTPLLGGIMAGRQQKYLHLTQIMMEEGLITTKGKPPNVRYCPA